MEIKLMIRLLTLLLLTVAQASAQTSWHRVFAGNGYDKGEGACQLPDGSFLVTGSSSSFEDAPSQAFLMRVSSNGTFMWSAAYGSGESETGKRIMAVPGYGYYVAGTSSGSGSGDFDNYLFFTGEYGAQQWEVFTDNGAWERIHDAELLPDTTILTVGETDSNTTANPDIFLVRYGRTGNVIWSKQFGSDGADIAYAVEIASDTTVLIAGTFYVADSLKNKAFLAMVRIDNGGIVWQKTYGDNGDYQLNDLSLYSGEIKAVGERTMTGKTDHDEYHITASLATGVMTGALEQYYSNDSRYGAFIQYEPGANGKHFVVTQAINPSIPTFEIGEDAIISRFAPQLYWDGYGVSYSGIGQDQINQMIRTSDGFALAVGFHTTYGPGGNSIMLVKIGNDQYFPAFNMTVYDIVHLTELSVLKHIAVFPNPVSDRLMVNVPEVEFSWTLLDATGKELFAGTAYGQQTLDFSAQSAGIYFLSVRHGSGEIAVVKVVK